MFSVSVRWPWHKNLSNLRWRQTALSVFAAQFCAQCLQFLCTFSPLCVKCSLYFQCQRPLLRLFDFSRFYSQSPLHAAHFAVRLDVVGCVFPSSQPHVAVTSMCVCARHFPLTCLHSVCLCVCFSAFRCVGESRLFLVPCVSCPPIMCALLWCLLQLPCA